MPEDNREASIMRGLWPTRGVHFVAIIFILTVTKSCWFLKRFLDKLHDTDGILTDQSLILLLPAVST